MANSVEKKNNLDIQQLTLGPITNDDSNNSETVSNPDSIDDETVSKFFAIINNAIWAAYSKNEKTPKILNALNTNQRILKKILLSETKLVDGRIYFKNKMFVPDVGQLKLRFIQKFHDDPAAKHPGKTKPYVILNRYYYWPGIIICGWNCYSFILKPFRNILKQKWNKFHMTSNVSPKIAMGVEKAKRQKINTTVLSNHCQYRIKNGFIFRSIS